MSFKDHFNDISDLIIETVDMCEVPIDVDRDLSTIDEHSVVNFWNIDPSSPHKADVKLKNVLRVNGRNHDVDDLYFNTKCVGYAIEHGHSNVIVESDEGSYCIAISFDESIEDVPNYITEAGKRSGPLAGKKISKDKRAEIKKTRDSAKKHQKLNRSTSTKRPGKSPAKGMNVGVLLTNTGKLSPDRVERAMKQVRKQPPKLTGVKEIDGQKYFRAEYNFVSQGSAKRQIGYADISHDKKMCSEMFCSCSDFFYRLYAPYVAAGLSTWNVPAKYQSKQTANVKKAPHNHKWTVDTNPEGKLFLCKHLWAFMAYYVAGDAGNMELSDEDIKGIMDKYFVDVDGDGEEDAVDSEFMKAFGKLYVGQQGQDIEHIEDKDNVKKGDRKQTFYKLPKNKKVKDEVDDDEK